jgi:hypothetical protein
MLIGGGSCCTPFGSAYCVPNTAPRVCGIPAQAEYFAGEETEAVHNVDLNFVSQNNIVDGDLERCDSGGEPLTWNVPWQSDRTVKKLISEGSTIFIMFGL